MNREKPRVELLFGRLATDDVATDVAETVLAALAGEGDLTAASAGQPTAPDLDREAPPGPRPKIHLTSVTVAGFRGVGPGAATQHPARSGPDPRRGTQRLGQVELRRGHRSRPDWQSARWADKNSVWRSGRRKLHVPDRCAISVELNTDGTAQPTRISRSWPVGADLSTPRLPSTCRRPPWSVAAFR
jgi:hypothetical protein